MDDVARTFVELVSKLADVLGEGFDPDAFLTRLIDGCVELPGVDAAGVIVTDESGTPRVAGATAEYADAVLLAELRHDDGPGLRALRDAVPVVETDLARWPAYAAEAGRLDVHALPLRLRDQTIGALVLVTKAGGLDEQSALLARSLAHVATASLLTARALRHAEGTASQLQSALDSRVTIEQAKGMLRERLGVDAAGAFDALRRYSRTHNQKMVDVAEGVLSGRITLP